MTIKQNGKDIGTVDILADRDIDKAGIYDYFKQIIRNWASASYNKLEQKMNNRCDIDEKCAEAHFFVL